MRKHKIIALAAVAALSISLVGCGSSSGGSSGGGSNSDKPLVWPASRPKEESERRRRNTRPWRNFRSV